jgi:hypothetical protein
MEAGQGPSWGCSAKGKKDVARMREITIETRFLFENLEQKK